MGNMMGGMGGMGGGQQTPEAMQQLLIQMMAAQGMKPPSEMGRTPSPPNNPAAPTATKPSPSSIIDKKKRDNAVDVEFEKSE
mmetsp:Transcript_12080/g.29499  ORF Transcript_12080/g.29499 Transcript_12080/m.29499 type:complete len:82 (+) Transcript_12080:3-248(+)